MNRLSKNKLRTLALLKLQKLIDNIISRFKNNFLNNTYIHSKNNLTSFFNIFKIVQLFNKLTFKNCDKSLPFLPKFIYIILFMSKVKTVILKFINEIATYISFIK